MSKAVYPGSFDPVTYGHLDVIRRGAAIFSELVVAVARNPVKEELFSFDERVAMIRAQVRDLPNVRVESFEGLAVDYVRRKGAKIILRGIRTISDFEYEFAMALTNRTFARDIETVFVMTSENYSFISSRLIKEAAALGGDVSGFVPKDVQQRLRERLGAKSLKPVQVRGRKKK